MEQEKLLERIYSKVSVNEDGCAVWGGSRRRTGKAPNFYYYGQQWFDGRHWLVHRLFWVRSKGPVPRGKELDHVCRNKLCVNLEHLRAVTHRENMKNRAVCDKTHCKCGEVLTLNSKGYKICRKCRDLRVKVWREANRDRWNEISRRSYAKMGKTTNRPQRGQEWLQTS